MDYTLHDVCSVVVMLGVSSRCPRVLAPLIPGGSVWGERDVDCAHAQRPLKKFWSRVIESLWAVRDESGAGDPCCGSACVMRACWRIRSGSVMWTAPMRRETRRSCSPPPGVTSSSSGSCWGKERQWTDGTITAGHRWCRLRGYCNTHTTHTHTHTTHTHTLTHSRTLTHTQDYKMICCLDTNVHQFINSSFLHSIIWSFMNLKIIMTD